MLHNTMHVPRLTDDLLFGLVLIHPCISLYTEMVLYYVFRVNSGEHYL